MASFLLSMQAMRDKRLVVLLATALALNFISWIFLFARTWGLREAVPQFALHYTIYFGVDRLGSWWQIFRGPLAGLIFLLVNAAIAIALHRRERLWSLCMAAASVVFEALILLGSVFVVLLNV